MFANFLLLAMGGVWLVETGYQDVNDPTLPAVEVTALLSSLDEDGYEFATLDLEVHWLNLNPTGIPGIADTAYADATTAYFQRRYWSGIDACRDWNNCGHDWVLGGYWETGELPGGEFLIDDDFGRGTLFHNGWEFFNNGEMAFFDPLPMPTPGNWKQTWTEVDAGTIHVARRTMAVPEPKGNLGWLVVGTLIGWSLSTMRRGGSTSSTRRCHGATGKRRSLAHSAATRGVTNLDDSLDRMVAGHSDKVTT